MVWRKARTAPDLNTVWGMQRISEMKVKKQGNESHKCLNVLMMQQDMKKKTKMHQIWSPGTDQESKHWTEYSLGVQRITNMTFKETKLT